MMKAYFQVGRAFMLEKSFSYSQTATTSNGLTS